MHDRVALSAIRKTSGVGAARVGIGGPVGSGKTALIERLIPVLTDRGIDLAVVTNDLVTCEDAERLQRGGLIDPGRVSAVEAGACSFLHTRASAKTQRSTSPPATNSSVNFPASS